MFLNNLVTKTFLKDSFLRLWGKRQIIDDYVCNLLTSTLSQK